RAGEAPAPSDRPLAGQKLTLEAVSDRLNDLQKETQLLRKELEALRKDHKRGSAPEQERDEVRIFRLRRFIEKNGREETYMDAPEVAQVLDQVLSPRGQAKIVAYPSTNSIIVRGNRASIEEVEAILARLENNRAEFFEESKRSAPRTS